MALPFLFWAYSELLGQIKQRWPKERASPDKAISSSGRFSNRASGKTGGFRLKIAAHPQIHHLGLEAASQFGIVAAGNRHPIA